MNLVERAKELAYRAHAGQVDKAGRPYIEHVARVAAAVSDDPEAEAVAWLHDVLEDHPHFADEVLDGYPSHVQRALFHLDRSWQPTAEDYYGTILQCQLALRVKLADIADNADEARLALLPADVADRLRKKYAKARQALGVEESK
jgi:(p)ppGpp synthase/HD superfamily hydrolase